MTATTIDQFKDGKRRLIMRGGLGCSTEVAQGGVRIGSRSAVEDATFEVEAVDGGIGGPKAGDSFAYTAFFNEKDAPVNFAIFGPKAVGRHGIDPPRPVSVTDMTHPASAI